MNTTSSIPRVIPRPLIASTSALLVLACALLTAACSSGKDSGDSNTWTFYSPNPLTGAQSAYSTFEKFGFKLAEQKINAAGGIGGRKVKVVLQDTQDSQGRLLQLVRQDCEDSLAVLGPLVSNLAAVTFPVAESLQCPTITSSAAATGLTGPQKKWTYAYSSAAPNLTTGAVQTMASKLDIKRAVVVTDNENNSALVQANVGISALKKLGIAHQQVFVTNAMTNYGPVASKIEAFNPDLVLLATQDTDGVGVLKALRDDQTDASILIAQSAYTGLFTKQPAAVMNGTYTYSEFPVLASEAPEVRGFVGDYKKASGGELPNQIATQAYDLLFLVKHVIEKANLEPPTSDSLASERSKFVQTLSALEGARFGGLDEPFTMGTDHYGVHKGAVLKTVNDKQVVFGPATAHA